MYKWILRCLDFKKSIFIIAAIVLIATSFGFRYLQFDFKLDVMKEGHFPQQIAYITIYDKQLLDSSHLRQLAELQKKLSTIKQIKKITSLYTVPNLRRYLEDNEWHSVLEDDLYVNDTLNQVKTDVLENKLFIGKFINSKADTMLFYLYFSSDKYGVADIQVRAEIQQILNQYQGSFSKIFQSGTPEMTHVFAEKSTHDFLVCMPVLVILMTVFFGFLFRHPVIALFPLGITSYGLACALGAMGWLGIPVSELCIVAIVLTLAISVASCAHIIYAYQESILYFPNSLMRERFYYLLKKVLLPFILAVCAALLGFLLDILSFVPVIQNLSYAFALCILFATFSIVFISPLLLSTVNMPNPKEKKLFHAMINVFLKLNDFCIQNSVIFVVILVLASIAGFHFSRSMTIESLPYSFFSKNDPFMKNIYFTGKQVSGQNILQVDISSKQEDIFYDSKYLQKILDEEKKILSIPGTSYTYSVADVIATTYQIFLFNTEQFFKIPKSPQMLTSIYSSLSTQEFMDSLINKKHNVLSLYISYDIYSTVPLEKYKEVINLSLQKALSDTPLNFTVKDFWAEYAYIVKNILLLQIFSIFSIYFICFVVVGILLRSTIAGIISIVPNIIPLCILVAVQFFLKIPISVVSVILYSIVVGLSIDETVHMFYSFREEYLKLQDRHLAAKAALRSQLIPVTIASASIALSCFALLSSSFLPVAQLGFLVGVGVCSTWLADLVITPFLLRSVDITKRLSHQKIDQVVGCKENGQI